MTFLFAPVRGITLAKTWIAGDHVRRWPAAKPHYGLFSRIESIKPSEITHL